MREMYVCVRPGDDCMDIHGVGIGEVGEDYEEQCVMNEVDQKICCGSTV